MAAKTGENLAGGTAAFTITFSEANGFEPDSKTIKIQTVKTDPPDVQLAEFGLDDTEGELSFGNGNGIVEPGESIVLNLALLNNGDGITKDTKITFESGDSEIHFIDNTQFSKGNIQPGGKVSLNTAFSISRRYKGSSTLPIKMKITDERKRFSKEIPLNIALKRSYPKTEIINIASNYKKPQKIKTQTDPLNNIPDAKTQNKYGVAVIIGVRNYENKVPPVLFAINNAQTVRDYAIKALGYNPDNIIYVENPTKGQMEEIFGTDKTHKGRLFNYIKPDRSDVLVYYAGHGAPDQGTKTAFFVPKDANPDYIKIGGYSHGNILCESGETSVKEYNRAYRCLFQRADRRWQNDNKSCQSACRKCQTAWNSQFKNIRVQCRQGQRNGQLVCGKTARTVHILFPAGIGRPGRYEQ